MTTCKTASWQNPRILLMLLIVFLCGATAGMLAMSIGHHRSARINAQPSWKDSNKEVSLQALKKELNLTPQQSEQLETVLDDFFTYYHTLQAQLDDVRASGKQRVLRILNEEQKRKFEKMTGHLQDKELR